MQSMIKTLFEEEYKRYITRPSLYACNVSREMFARILIGVQLNHEFVDLYHDYEQLITQSGVVETPSLENWTLALAAIHLWLNNKLDIYDLEQLEPAFCTQIVASVLNQHGISHQAWIGSIDDVFDGKNALVEHSWLILCNGSLTVDFRLSSLLNDPYVPCGIFLTCQVRRSTYVRQSPLNLPYLSDRDLQDISVRYPKHSR